MDRSQEDPVFYHDRLNTRAFVQYFQEEKFSFSVEKFNACGTVPTKFDEKKKLCFYRLSSIRFGFFFDILQTSVGRKAVSQFVRVQMVALNDAGFNQVQVSKQLKIARCCVENAIKELNDQGVRDDMKRSERPRKVYVCDFPHLKRLVKGNMHLTVAKIKADFEYQFNETCCNAIISQIFEDIWL